MMKIFKYIVILVIIYFLSALLLHAAPTVTPMRTIVPEINNTYSLGSHNLNWLYIWGKYLRITNATITNATSTHFYTPEICLNGDCKTAWPTGGGGSSFNQWLDTTNTPTFVGLNATSSSIDTLCLNGVCRTTWPSGGLGGTWATTSEQYFWNTTSTWAYYDTNWARNYNATTTLNGFNPNLYLLTSAFNTYFATAYNATTTLNGFSPNLYLLITNFQTNFANSYNATTTLNGFSPNLYLLISNFASNWATQYNATTTLNGFSPNLYLLISNFATNWNTSFNGTSTWTAFDTNWSRNANATTTYPGFATQFASAYNATTTQAGFTTQFATAYNATTTQAGFANQFASYYNATTTQAGFESQFNSFLNASSTIKSTSAGGTLLQKNGDIFSVKEGTLTNTKGCTFVTGTGLVCNSTFLTTYNETDPNFTTWAGYTDGRISPLNSTTTNIDTLTVYTSISGNGYTWDTLNKRPATSTVLNLLDTQGRIAMLNSTTTNVGSLMVYSGLNASSTSNFTNLNVYTGVTSTAGYVSHEFDIATSTPMGGTTFAVSGNSILAGNNTSTGRLVLGTTNPTNNWGSKLWLGGDLYTNGSATTSNSFYSAGQIYINTTTPWGVSTALAVTGNSIFAGTSTTTGRLVLGTTNPTNNFGNFLWVGGDEWIKGNSTTTGLYASHRIDIATSTPIAGSVLNVSGNSILGGNNTSTGTFSVGTQAAGNSTIEFYSTNVLKFVFGENATNNWLTVAPLTLGTGDLWTLDTFGNSTTTGNVVVAGTADSNTNWIEAPFLIRAATTTNAVGYLIGAGLKDADGKNFAKFTVDASGNATTSQNLTVSGTGAFGTVQPSLQKGINVNSFSSDITDNTRYGVFASTTVTIGGPTSYGLYGLAKNIAAGGGIAYGVYGKAVGEIGTQTNYGLYGDASGIGNNYGLYSGNNLYVVGNATTTLNLTVSGKSAFGATQPDDDRILNIKNSDNNQAYGIYISDLNANSNENSYGVYASTTKTDNTFSTTAGYFAAKNTNTNDATGVYTTVATEGDDAWGINVNVTSAADAAYGGQITVANAITGIAYGLDVEMQDVSNTGYGIYVNSASTKLLGSGLYVANGGTYLNNNATTTGHLFLTGLEAALGTPSTICMDSTSKEITVNAALTCTVSARDQKTKISPIYSSGIDIINKLLPENFAYKDQPDRMRYGFIADEVQSVDPKLGDAYDKNGNARSLDENALLAISIKAIQELNLKIEKLQIQLDQNIIMCQL